MCLTLESDYAIRIIGCLSAETERIDAKRISEATGVSLRFSLKILRKLVGAGLVRSFKGMQGGYELAKDPREISMLDVIEVVEGDFFLNKCHDEDFVCTRLWSGKEGCAYRKVFEEISEAVREKLRNCSFAELIGEKADEGGRE